MKTTVWLVAVLVAFGTSVSAETEHDPDAQEMASATVARAQVTTAVVDREPQDSVDRISGDVATLSYFTELVGLEGQTVSHVWAHQGTEKARVSFEVGGPRWRVHSTKRFDPSGVGAWTVSAVTQSGVELRSDHFYYAVEESASDTASPTAPESATPPAAPN